MGDLSKHCSDHQSVLILARVGADASISHAVLKEVNISSVICANVDELCESIDAGAGAMLVAEESLTTKGLKKLQEKFACQPPWSMIPLILVTRSGERSIHNALTLRLSQSMSHVTLLDRPTRLSSLVSLWRESARDVS